MGQLLFQVQLMYPPSTNHLYGRKLKSGKRDMSQAVKTFRNDSLSRIWGRGMPTMIEIPIRFEMSLSVPDRRIRDIDNTVQSVFNVLKLAKVIRDDSQIRRMEVEFLENEYNGFCQVSLYTLHKTK